MSTEGAYVTHAVRVEPPYFDALLDGSKPFEVRRNDRAYQRGDFLRLREWHPARAGYDECWKCRNAAWDGHYTGREVRRWVTYVYAGDPRWPDSLGVGVVVLGLALACASCGGRESDPPCCRNPDEHLVAAMTEFDPSDAYHASDVQEPGYYAAIDRCIRLVKGEIKDWRSPASRGELK